MATEHHKIFLREYGVFLLILTVALLAGIASYYAARSGERRMDEREMKLATQILNSKQEPEEVATELEGVVQALHEDQFWIGVLRHVSIAFFISFIVILAVELHTRRLSRKDFEAHLEAVKQNVWAAIGKRLLGQSIASELEAIMREKAAKVNCRYFFTFKRPPNGPSYRAGHVVVQVLNSFQLRSLSDERKSDRVYHFRSNVSGYEEVADLPKYTLFRKGNDQPENNPAADTENKALLVRDIQLPAGPDERVEVTVGMEIPYKLRDSEAFITEVPIEGLEVFVSNLVSELVGNIRLDMIHRCEEVENPVDGYWKFSRAILPGQGFNISWNEAVKQLTGQVATDSAPGPSSDLKFVGSIGSANPSSK